MTTNEIANELFKKIKETAEAGIVDERGKIKFEFAEKCGDYAKAIRNILLQEALMCKEFGSVKK